MWHPLVGSVSGPEHIRPNAPDHAAQQYETFGVAQWDARALAPSVSEFTEDDNRRVEPAGHTVTRCQCVEVIA